MSDAKRIILGLLLWTTVVSAMHLGLNFDWSVVINDRLPENKRKFNVAYIPVTCHLACPVTDYISRRTDLGNIFIPRMFQGFPEIKEALIANKMQADDRDGRSGPEDRVFRVHRRQFRGKR